MGKPTGFKEFPRETVPYSDPLKRVDNWNEFLVDVPEEHLRTQGAPRFDETLIRAREESEAQEERGDDVDDLYDRALSIVAESRNASISYLQRRLKVGYNRAARMIEQMELEGVVGPQEGTKPREIYAQPVGGMVE